MLGLPPADDVAGGSRFPASPLSAGPKVPAGDVLSVQFKTAAGVSYTGIDYYKQAAEEASQMVAKHQLDESDARAGVLLYRLGSELEADLFIISRGWLLAERGRPHGKHLANIVSPRRRRSP